jgi:hypothetical protein
MSDNDFIQEARRFGGEWGRALADRLEAANARVARIERLLEHVDAARAGYDALVVRADQLEKALARAAYVAEHLFQMVDRETWRSTGGDDGQGHYEGDYRAEQVQEEIREWAALAGVSAEPATEEKCGSFGCVLPKGHNTGRADIPENHVSSVSAGAVKALIADASEPFLVPDVTPRGASKAAVFHVLRDMVDAGALEHHVDGYRRPNAAASAGAGQAPSATTLTRRSWNFIHAMRANGYPDVARHIACLADEVDRLSALASATRQVPADTVKNLRDVAAAAWGYRVFYEAYWGEDVPGSALPLDRKQAMLAALVGWQNELDAALAALDDNKGDFAAAIQAHRATVASALAAVRTPEEQT